MGSYVVARTLKTGLRPVLRPFWDRATYSGFADTRYFLPDAHEYCDMLDGAPLPPHASHGEIFDCDDYAFALKAHISRYARLSYAVEAPICIGIAWGLFHWHGRILNHACNWTISANGTFCWIEPQLLIDGFSPDAFFPVEQCAGRLDLLLV